MRASLQRWINNADTARHLRHFQFTQLPIELGPIDHRLDDYYISLVGELFANLHQPRGRARGLGAAGQCVLTVLG